MRITSIALFTLLSTTTAYAQNNPTLQPVRPLQPLPQIQTQSGPTVIQQFGNTSTIRAPNQPTVVCTRFGNTTTCR